MILTSKSLVNIASSTALVALFCASAHADIDALSLSGGDIKTGSMTSSYTFTSSMILNSIGFVTNGYTPEYMSYTLKGVTHDVTTSDLGGHIGGIRWLDFSTGITMDASDTLSVYTQGYAAYGPSPDTDYKAVDAVNANANVSFNSNYGGANFTNSNIRVSPSNPGSNVAPEPGTFALALTGGAALIGICIRRRRNAA